MKIKRVIFVLFMVLIMTVSVSADAIVTSSLPAKEPWTIEAVDTTPNNFPGQYVSIAHHPVTGRAYISYYTGYDYLGMAHEVDPGTGDCPGNDDWNCILFGSGGNDIGRYSSIDVDWVVPGAPAISYTKIGISYYDATQKSLKYFEYRSTTDDWTYYEIDDSTNVENVRGAYSSLKFTTDHQPIIAYHYISYDVGTLGDFGGVKLASFNSSGTGSGCYGEHADYWDCETVASMNDYTDYGSHVSLDLTADDTTHIAFYDSFNSQLVWATYWGSGGSCNYPAWNCVTVDGAGDVGQFVSIHAPKSSTDKLRFAYFDNTTSLGKVKYAVKVPSGGNCTSSVFNCFNVDEIGDPPGPIGISITVDNQGYPIIAYMDASPSTSATKLRVARPALAYGNTAGNCGEVPPGDAFLYWQCELLDPGYQNIVHEAAFADVSISPGGLAGIAYYEYDSVNDEGILKFAQQHYMLYLPAILK